MSAENVFRGKVVVRGEIYTFACECTGVKCLERAEWARTASPCAFAASRERAYQAPPAPQPNAAPLPLMSDRTCTLHPLTANRAPTHTAAQVRPVRKSQDLFPQRHPCLRHGGRGLDRAGQPPPCARH